jgi:hypothetical protein
VAALSAAGAHEGRPYGHQASNIIACDFPELPMHGYFPEKYRTEKEHRGYSRRPTGIALRAGWTCSKAIASFHASKNPARGSGRAQCVSFNFRNNLIRAARSRTNS